VEEEEEQKGLEKLVAWDEKEQLDLENDYVDLRKRKEDLEEVEVRLLEVEWEEVYHQG